MTLKIGDKVVFVEPYITHSVGDEATVIEDEKGIAGAPHVRLRTADGRTPWPMSKRVKKIEEPPRPLGLSAGDKVVNLKTGREGLVLKGPISGELKVYDQKPPIKDAVPAAALEEYEFHYPGTYDVWRRVTVKKKCEPW